MPGRLAKNSVVLFGIQSGIGQDANPSPTTNALQVFDPDYSVDPEVIERNFLSASLSPNPFLMGRKLAQLKFKVEAKGNGKQQSGAVADAPMIAQCMRACGFGLSPFAANTGYSFVVPDFANPASAPAVAVSKSGNVTLKKPAIYTVEITTAGASGTAKAAVTCNTSEDAGSSNLTVTTATAIALGAKGGSFTPTFSGSLPLGMKWRVYVAPTCILAKPISANFEMGTIYYYADGLLHKILDAMGTFSYTGEAGNFGEFEFTFTGKYSDPLDVIPPAATFEPTDPPKVELADLTWGSNINLLINDFSFDLAGEISERKSVNHADGFYGIRMTNRAPKGGFTPEAELEGTQAFWSDMANGRRRQFSVTLGAQSGNMIGCFQPSVQTDALGYGDRDGILTYDVGLRTSRYLGDDEVVFVFL